MTKISNRIERALRGSRVARALGVERDIEEDATEPNDGGDYERRFRRAIATSSVYRALSSEPTNETVEMDFSEALVVGPMFGVLTRAGNAAATCWRGSILRREVHRMADRLKRVGPEGTRRIVRALFVPVDPRRDKEEGGPADDSGSDRASELSGSTRE